jgi:hypothetical protein
MSRRRDGDQAPRTHPDENPSSSAMKSRAAFLRLRWRRRRVRTPSAPGAWSGRSDWPHRTASHRIPERRDVQLSLSCAAEAMVAPAAPRTDHRSEPRFFKQLAGVAPTEQVVTLDAYLPGPAGNALPAEPDLFRTARALVRSRRRGGTRIPLPSSVALQPVAVHRGVHDGDRDPRRPLGRRNSLDGDRGSDTRSFTLPSVHRQRARRRRL